MIPTPRSDLIIGHQTHQGETGKNNEDRALNMSFEGLPEEIGDITLAVIADGIGGHRAGEVASQIAVDTFKELFKQTDSRAYLDLFTRAFASTQQAITKHIAANPDSEGMGTTCSVALVANRRLYTAFIGDSRIYLLRDGAIRQISVDHTWVQEAIEHGVLTKAEARKHPNRHVVRRHIGAAPDVTPDFRLQLDDSEKPETARRNQGLSLKPGDIVLISSDGLTDLVEDHEILANFEGRTPSEAVEALVLLARERGGFDNITVTALKVPSKKLSNGGSRNLLAPALLGGTLALIIGAIVLIGAIVGLYFVFFNDSPRATLTLTATNVLPTLTATAIPSATLAPTTAPPPSPTLLPPTLTKTPQPTAPPSLTPTPSNTLDQNSLFTELALTQINDKATLAAMQTSNAALPTATTP